MQANVREILTAANSLEAFEKVVDRPKIGKDDVPAFIVLGRTKVMESFNTSLNHYNGPWEYQCLIVAEMDNDNPGTHTSGGEDFDALEALFTDFCSAMLGDGKWELLGEADYDFYSPNGRELLGVAFTLGKQGMDRF